MARVMLINPNYYDDIFRFSKVRSAISRSTIQLGLACIAAPLVEAGHDVKILDLNLTDKPEEYLRNELRTFCPDFAGITATTPLIKKAYQIAGIIKELLPEVIVVAGGPHPSALPHDVLAESVIDCVVKGEGDFILKEIAEKGLSQSIPNIIYKINGLVHESENLNYVTSNLDNLSYPAYQLFDIPQYRQPMISSRTWPLGYMETSRGCYAKCIYCNKNIHGFKVRMKSPLRVVDEMERMLSLGFREIHIIDDIFTADMDRAYKICEEILRRDLNFPWYPRGGIRVEKVSHELLVIMRKAGCYRIPFGIESGSPKILERIKKKITLDQAERAVAMAKEAGLETECYFMIGLPGETEDDILQSIAFAVKLNPDYSKFAITVPLPGTPMFEEMLKNGQIKTTDWDKFNFSVSPRELYEHDTLSWEQLDHYIDISHRKFYFRPGYITHMIFKTIRNGTFTGHIKAFINTRW